MYAFARIYKVDEATRTVHGRATEEIVDKDNEMMDYFSSKPEFQKWSAEVFADTNGASYGNVRSMHSNVAAGKLTDIQFLDGERAIDVTAKIVDNNEWQKVCEGVMTGFSIGGKYGKKWAAEVNGRMVNKYTAVPNEISIVDRPCVSTAKFYSFTKMDGSVMQKAFQTRKSNIDFSGGRIALTKDAQLDPFRKIHARGPQNVGGSLLKLAQPVSDRQREANTIMQKRTRMTGDWSALRKVGFPTQSSNATSGGAIADTGASNNFHDQEFDKPIATRVGGTTITDVSRSPNIDAATNAMKAALRKPAGRMGA